MNYTTRILLILLAAGCCTVSLAQTPPSGEATDGTPVEEPVPGESDEGQTDEEAPAGGTPDIEAEDPAALVEEDPAVAASAEEEFNPDEEISEDYPVPLPADI